MNENTLHLNEIFTSIQGETSYTGLPTTFVRLARCNLRCRWCDTPYSFGRGDAWKIDAIIAHVLEKGAPFVCITGGEPLLQAGVHTLMAKLCDAGLRVSIETGGSLPTDPIDPRVKTVLDLKCPGSGMEDKNLWENLSKLRPHDEVKFVLADRIDYDYALEVCRRYGLFEQVQEVLLSPVFEELEAKKLVAWILEDKLAVRLNLQTHKFIWHPQTIGV